MEDPDARVDGRTCSRRDAADERIAGATPRGRVGQPPRRSTGPSDPHDRALESAVGALVYNEAFSRAGMFLAFLSMSFVALIRAGAEDFRAIHGMNRIRHGYVEIAPVVAPYFTTSIHDDMPGIFATYGGSEIQRRTNLVRWMTTTAGMVVTTVSLVAGVLAGVLMLALVESVLLACRRCARSGRAFCGMGPVRPGIDPEDDRQPGGPVPIPGAPRRCTDHRGVADRGEDVRCGSGRVASPG